MNRNIIIAAALIKGHTVWFEIEPKNTKGESVKAANNKHAQAAPEDMHVQYNH